jgi:hypothetical protein
VRSKVLMAASMKFRVFWDIASCSYVEVDRRFRGAYCIHNHGDAGDGDSPPCWWRQYAPLKRRSTPMRLHSATSQKILNFYFMIFALVAKKKESCNMDETGVLTSGIWKLTPIVIKTFNLKNRNLIFNLKSPVWCWIRHVGHFKVWWQKTKLLKKFRILQIKIKNYWRKHYEEKRCMWYVHRPLAIYYTNIFLSTHRQRV